MRKLLAIIWKENYERFTDRGGILFMLVTPLALAVVIGLAFSDIAGTSDVPNLHIPVGIVNLDEGTEQGTFGDIFVQAMVPEDPENADPDNPLFTMFDARTIASEDAARALVESGELTAVLIIPPDFSQSLMLTPEEYVAVFTGSSDDGALIGHAQLTLYRNSQSQIGWAIFRDVVQGIANGIATGNIAINTTISGLLQANPAIGLQMASGELNDTFAQIAQEAAQPDANPIRLREVDISGEAVTFDPMSFFGPGIAVFFVGFTMMIGSASVLQEQRNWTLQRMVTTPTPRAVILGGKMLGTYVGGLLQMTMLIIAMDVMASILRGSFVNIWGDDVLALILLTMAIVAAGTGLGVILSGFARTFEQATNLGSVVLVLMGLLGGSFFPPPEGMQFLSRLTFHHWGSSGYTALATGDVLADILPNIAALLLMAVVYFGIGLWLFSRRLDI